MITIYVICQKLYYSFFAYVFSEVVRLLFFCFYLFFFAWLALLTRDPRLLLAACEDNNRQRVHVCFIIPPATIQVQLTKSLDASKPTFYRISIWRFRSRESQENTKAVIEMGFSDVFFVYVCFLRGYKEFLINLHGL